MKRSWPRFVLRHAPLVVSLPQVLHETDGLVSHCTWEALSHTGPTWEEPDHIRTLGYLGIQWVVDGSWFMLIQRLNCPYFYENRVIVLPGRKSEMPLWHWTQAAQAPSEYQISSRSWRSQDLGNGSMALVSQYSHCGMCRWYQIHNQIHNLLKDYIHLHPFLGSIGTEMYCTIVQNIPRSARSHPACSSTSYSKCYFVCCQVARLRHVSSCHFGFNWIGYQWH